MRVLALNTATQSCSVAIVDDHSVLAEEICVSGQTHTVHVIDMLQRVLDVSGLFLADMDGIAVGRGPGSFTGLRIGISTVKALAVAAGKPIAGVSNLDALALQAAVSENLICPLMDARKGEVYFSRYCYENEDLHQIAPVRVSSLEAALADIHTGCVFIGEAARIYRKEIRATVGPCAVFAEPVQNTIRAATIGRLGMNRFKRGQTDDIVTLVPEYIRQSDAELGFGLKRLTNLMVYYRQVIL